MHILFVSSGNSGSVRPVVKSQGESLENKKLRISYFLIEGKGLLGYLKNVYRLRQVIKSNHFDVIHAHYSLTAFVASLSGCKPILVSLMGSDLEINKLFTLITRLMAKYWWSCTIVKSDEMAKKLKTDNVQVLPNGVEMANFTPLDKKECRLQLEWSNDEYHLLFAANPDRPVKNYELFNDALSRLKKKGFLIHAHVLKSVEHDQIPVHMNAADVVCLSSLREGSPNVVKEAMSCNRPVVSTDVGDVKWIFNNMEGHFISSMNAGDYAQNIEYALKFNAKFGQTSGRKRILDLGLDAGSFKNRMVELYNNIR